MRSVREHAGGQRVGNHVCSGATWCKTDLLKLPEAETFFGSFFGLAKKERLRGRKIFVLQNAIHVTNMNSENRQIVLEAHWSKIESL